MSGSDKAVVSPTLTRVDLPTSTFDRALHLALFVVGGIAFAVSALALLERIGDREQKPVVRLPHVAIPIAAFAAIGIAERLYHFLH